MHKALWVLGGVVAHAPSLLLSSAALLTVCRRSTVAAIGRGGWRLPLRHSFLSFLGKNQEITVIIIKPESYVDSTVGHTV